MAPISAEQFFITLASSCLFPFAARPMLTEVAAGAMIHAVRNWTSLLDVTARSATCNSAAISIRHRHIIEEFRFVGFDEMMQRKVHFTLQNPHFGEFVLSVLVLIIFLPPLLFSRHPFLAMLPMLLDMRLKNKAALITGSTGGMGRASARPFAKEGATVFVAARRPDIVVDGGWFSAAPYLGNERAGNMLELIKAKQEKRP